MRTVRDGARYKPSAAACASLPLFTMSKSRFRERSRFRIASDPERILGNKSAPDVPWRGGRLYEQSPRPVKPFCDVFFKKMFFSQNRRILRFSDRFFQGAT